MGWGENCLQKHCLAEVLLGSRKTQRKGAKGRRRKPRGNLEAHMELAEVFVFCLLRVMQKVTQFSPSFSQACKP